MESMKTLFFTLSLFLTLNPVLASDEIVDSMSEEQKEQFVLCAHQDQKFNHGLGTLYNFYEKYYDRFVEYEENLVAKGKLDPSKSFSNIVAKGAYDAEEGPRQVPTKKGDGGKGLIVRNDLAKGGYDAEEGPRQVPTKKGNGGKGLAVFTEDTTPLVKQVQVRRLFTFK